MQLKQQYYITDTYYTDDGILGVQDKIPKQNTYTENTSDATPDVCKMFNHYGTYFFSWFEAFS